MFTPSAFTSARRLAVDLSIDFDGPRHTSLRAYAAVAIVVWAVGVPAAAALRLRSGAARRRLLATLASRRHVALQASCE